MTVKGPLYLTPFKSTSPVKVPPSCTENLKEHHICNIRFIYANFVKGQHVVLNNVSDMNEARSIASFLKVFNGRNPSLVVCKCDTLFKWYYELTKIANLKTLVVQEAGTDKPTNFNNTEVVLISNNSLKALNELDIREWFILVVEDIDLIYNSRYLKSVQCEFKIGLTRLNFLMEPNIKLLWDIQRWANKRLIKDYDIFSESHKKSKIKVQKFYPDFWQRLTWQEMENSKPTNLEKKEYEKDVSEWAAENDLNIEMKFLRNLPRTRSKKVTERRIKKPIQKRTKSKRTRDIVLRTIYTRKTKRTCSPQNSNEIQVKTETDEPCIKFEDTEEQSKLDCGENIEEHSVFDILLGKNNKKESTPQTNEHRSFKVQCEIKEENPILDSLVGDTSYESVELNEIKCEEEEEKTECMILDSLLR